jgi:putative (di)nucleoside polyphosphate hydrolase
MEYELPTNLIGIIWKGKFRGQKQKWFIVKFEGKESEINIKTKSPEFIEWRWIDIEELPNVIVKFKKHIYDKLLKELILIV